MIFLSSVLIFFFMSLIFDRNIPFGIPNAHEWDRILDKSGRLKGGESLTWYIKFGGKGWYKGAQEEHEK